MIDTWAYPKLAHDGCRCPCTHLHPDTFVCEYTAQGVVLYRMFNEDIHMPMCRPCADAYLDRFMAEQFANESRGASGAYDT